MEEEVEEKEQDVDGVVSEKRHKPSPSILEKLFTKSRNRRLNRLLQQDAFAMHSMQHWGYPIVRDQVEKHRFDHWADGGIFGGEGAVVSTWSGCGWNASGTILGACADGRIVFCPWRVGDRWNGPTSSTLFLGVEGPAPRRVRWSPKGLMCGVTCFASSSALLVSVADERPFVVCRLQSPDSTCVRCVEPLSSCGAVWGSSRGGGLCRWDVRVGQHHVAKGSSSSQGSFGCVRQSGDGGLVVAAGESGLELWDGRLLGRGAVAKSNMTCGTLGEGSLEVADGGYRCWVQWGDGGVEQWDLRSMQREQKWEKQSAVGGGGELSILGSTGWLAVEGESCVHMLRLNGTTRCTLGMPQQPTSLSCHPNGGHLAYTLSDGSLGIWGEQLEM